MDISQWRTFVGGSTSVDDQGLDELEAHLRDQIADLEVAGLAADEAFLVAVKRLGSIDALTLEFAREYSGTLWRQLVLPERHEHPDGGRWIDAVAFAIGAAVAVEVARLAARFPDRAPAWFFRNVTLFVVPFLASYFGVRRRATRRQWVAAALALATTAVVVNVYPYHAHSATAVLVAAHLPVALWAVVAFLYMGGDVRSHERRMDVVRFTGEWFIYYVLLALGGGVLMGLTVLILEPVGKHTPDQAVQWVLPAGAAGAVVIAAWLVESKQRVIENMAPVLTMVFTPLFAIMLSVSAVVYAATGLAGAFDRDLLGAFDAMMVVVVGLVLYGVSARVPLQPPGWAERVQLVAVGAALVLDGTVLGSMVGRIGHLGLTPNRVAALGLNLVLLVDLAGTAWHLWRALTTRAPFHRLERWQVAYLPVFLLWAAAVAVVFPPAFGFR